LLAAQLERSKRLNCGMEFSKCSLSKDSERESMEVEKHIAYFGIALQGWKVLT
jgi:hypothetical protein